VRHSRRSWHSASGSSSSTSERQLALSPVRGPPAPSPAKSPAARDIWSRCAPASASRPGFRARATPHARALRPRCAPCCASASALADLLPRFLFPLCPWLRRPSLTEPPPILLPTRPFVGLDPPVALEIANLIREVARDGRVAFLLVSHMEHLATHLQPALIVDLTPRPPPPAASGKGTGQRRVVPLWRGHLSLPSRLVRRFCDYFFYSLPLIVCAFVATGAPLPPLPTVHAPSPYS
jgi:hypothetical protein